MAKIEITSEDGLPATTFIKLDGRQVEDCQKVVVTCDANGDLPRVELDILLCKMPLTAPPDPLEIESSAALNIILGEVRVVAVVRTLFFAHDASPELVVTELGDGEWHVKQQPRRADADG